MNSINVSVNENTNNEIINDTLVIDNKPVKLNGQNLKYMIFGYSLVQYLHHYEIIDDSIRQNIFERLPIVSDDVQKQIDFLQINFLSKDVYKALAKKYKNEIKANFKNKNKKTNKVKPVKINKKKSKEVDTNPLDIIVEETTTHLTPSSSEEVEKKPKRKYTKKTKNTEHITVEPVTTTEHITTTTTEPITTIEPVTTTETITVETVTITEPITVETVTTTTEPITVETVTLEPVTENKKTTKKTTKKDAPEEGEGGT